MKKYIIDIETKRVELQKGEDDINIFSSSVLGEVDFCDDEIRIEYSDKEAKAVITVSDALVTVHSTGVATSSLVFCKGKQCGGEYSMPEGTLQVTTYTYDIQNKLSSPEKTLTIDYEINFGGNVCDRSVITYKLK